MCTYVTCIIYAYGIRSTHSFGETHPLGRWKRSKYFWQEGIVAYESTSHLPIHVKNMSIIDIWLIHCYSVLLYVFNSGHVMILIISSVLCVWILGYLCVWYACWCLGKRTRPLGETYSVGRWQRSESFWQEGIVAYEREPLVYLSMLKTCSFL